MKKKGKKITECEFMVAEKKNEPQLKFTSFLTNSSFCNRDTLKPLCLTGT